MDVEPLWALAEASVGDSRSTCGHGAANEDYGSRFFAGASRASDLSHDITPASSGLKPSVPSASNNEW